MTQFPKLLIRRLLVVVASVLVAGMVSIPAQAQESAPPSLRITQIDTSSFPEMRVYVLGQNFNTDVQNLDVMLRQDGIEYPATTEVRALGTQTAIVLDAAENIRRPGQTGDPKYIEVGNIMTRLVGRNKLTVQGDWLAAFSPDRDNKLRIDQDWTRDHQAVANSLYLFQPISGLGNTALFNLIFNVLNQFDNSPVNPSVQRTMVVFSDGVDVVSSLQLEDVVSLAKEKNVAIHTVMLGASTPQARSNLERIALRTGGQYHQLTTLDALDAMWDQILAGRDQLVLGYRSQSSSPSEITVTAAAPGGPTVETGLAVSIDAIPVKVRIVDPQRNFSLVRSGATYEIPLEDLEPTTLPIQVEFIWPDERPRQLQRVEYIINDDTRLVEQEPFDQYTFPINGLSTGNYTLRVRAVDELGVESQSEPVPFSVQIDQPPPPTPTPIIQTEVVERINTVIQTSWTSYAALVIGLLSLLIALIVFFRKPERREQAAEFVTGAIKSLTEPWAPRKKDGKILAEAKARLVLVEGDASIPSPIPIRGQKILIGRDPSVSNVVLPDSHVSRYHCRITEESDGTFKIFDEGSTSGTYVNFEPVGMRGQVLKSDDVINIGPIGLRFELLEDHTVPYQPAMGSAAAGDAAGSYEDDLDDSDDDDLDDNTEIYQMQRPKRS